MLWMFPFIVMKTVQSILLKKDTNTDLPKLQFLKCPLDGGSSVKMLTFTAEESMFMKTCLGLYIQFYPANMLCINLFNILPVLILLKLKFYIIIGNHSNRPVYKRWTNVL